jgi:SAM-dependent methyltransferase
MDRPLLTARSVSLSLLLTALSLVALSLGGCASDPEGEQSVRPGINDAYVKDPSIKTWQARFERPDREIYAKREEIARMVALKPGQAVADIGAGTGFMSFLFAKQVGPTGKVYAVDLMPTFIAHIEERAKALGVRNVHAVKCGERDVGLPDESIDVAFGCDVYHHFEYPKTSMEALHRALKPGGEFVLVDFHRIPGRSSDWVLGHVRAGQLVFEREIIATGFRKIDEQDFLDTCYFVRFKKN